MDADLSKLLYKHDLAEAVPGLETEGVISFTRLLRLTDEDVDAMVQKEHFPIMTGRLLKDFIDTWKPGWISWISGSDCQKLTDAVKDGDRGAVKLALLAGRGQCRDLWSQRTPLHEAAKNGQAEVVRLLVESGFDVKARYWCELWSTY